MPDSVRKTLWFIALWLGGVGTLLIVALLIRAMIF
jgi:hypothetical protein